MDYELFFKEERKSMKINASHIAMESDHSYSSSGLSLNVIKDMKREDAAALNISKEGISYLTLLNSDPDRREKQSAENRKNAGLAMALLHRAEAGKRTERPPASSEEESPEIRALKQLLEMMKRWAKGDYSTTTLDLSLFEHKRRNTAFSVGVSDGSSCTFFGSQYNESFTAGGSFSLRAPDFRSPASVEAGTGRLMTRVTASYNVINEHEETAFRTVGTALTEDGRAINFNVEFGMTRSFSAAFESLKMEDYSVALCDPLVINVGADVADISDQKFLFDLDSDGREESISALSEGSGFLALDKNGDGRVNNGSELFGTSSGDGFKDLSGYDTDKNGWIDEGDAVYNRLKVWFTGGDGEQKLLSLKEAGVGAIYLGNVSTEFSDKNVLTGELNGIVRRSGIFLREDGGAGTVQHVDFAI